MSILLTLLLLFFIVPLHPVIILVHGTFARDLGWCKPKGGFYEELDKEAKKIGQTVIPFMWSGRITHKSRVKAAESLAKLIVSYSVDEEIILVGHSHGGNIINLASHLLHDPLDEIMQIYWQEGGSDSIPSFIEKMIAEYGLLARHIASKKQYLIDKVYLLATPVLEKDFYAPCMDVIGQVYNLYSLGDIVQPVLGLYRRTYAKQDRLKNLRVKARKSGYLGNNNPTHRAMHTRIIASSLLSLSPDKSDFVWF